LIISDNQKG